MKGVKMNFLKTKILALLMIALVSFNTHSDIMLDPSSCVVDTTCWTDDMTDNPNLSDIETIIGLSAGALTDLLYKQDAGGVEAGTFADSYSNVITLGDSDSIAISYDGLPDPFIDTCAGILSCFLSVKDGGVADPNIWVFDISGWNGMMNIDIINLYPDMGSISNFVIWGGVGTPPCEEDCGGGGQEIPEPSVLFLFAGGLLGLAWSRRHITD